MDLKTLGTFMKLIESGTYSIAAKELFISQPTVTTRIQALEEELGVKLIRRSGQGYRPTEEGDVLAGYAGRILQIHEECKRAVSRIGMTKKGTLRIGTTALGTYILPDISKKFQEYFPESKLFFSISNMNEALDNLKNGSVDAVLTPLSLDAEKSEEFLYVKVCDDALVLVASTENPISRNQNVLIDDLRKERFILREEGSNTRQIFEDWLYQNHFDLRNVIEMQQPEAIRRAVAKNAGISLLSLLSLSPEDPSVKVLDLEGLPILREFYVVSYKKQPYDPMISAFSEFVKEML